MRSTRSVGTTLLALLLGTLGAWAQPASADYDFNRDIRPILSGKCFKCHGPDAGSREAKLRLDQRDAAIDAGAIAPDAPNKSELIARISTHDRDDRMPPKGKALSADQIAKLTAWIEDGAPYEEHWAYVPPVEASIPDAAHPIDHLVLKRLEKAGLKRSPEAEPAVLLRRLYLDLVGLVPSIEDVKAFESDPSPQKYEAQIDRLLRSEHFGEKWATGWLDLARYADSNGYQHDDLRTMWPYRDWVIRALNNDMPFDQFTIEQLAGDLLPDPTTDQLVATGFNRNVPTNFSGGTKVDEIRANVLHDRVATTGAVWLGLTLECAQCHDHKFDAILQKDYYQIYAYFNQAIPEIAQKDVDMFKKYFVGHEIAVYESDATEKKANELRQALRRLEKGVGADKETTASQEETSILEFEKAKPLAKNHTTHPAETSMVRDAPKGGGAFASKTLVKPTVRSAHFGTGYSFPEKNLSEISSVAFWIKTDMASRFNFQVHDRANGTSAFGFNVDEFTLGSWTRIVAPKTSFKKPQWAKQEADWKQVTKIQLTAHGSGPYANNYIILDKVAGLPATEESLRLQRVERLRKELATLETSTMVMRDAAQPVETHLMIRGDYASPGESVEPGVVTALHPLDPNLPPNRLGLAQWLVAPENPLTARVTVNRLWGELFGTGLVTTPEDFGMQGEAPTHPQLLDWLALEFVRQGWSTKQLIKTIAMSSTYRQSSAVPAEKIAKDPANRWLARGPRFRLPAELIRDNLLAVSRQLSDKIGGPSVYPLQPAGLWDEISGADITHYPTSRGEDRYRRGLYTALRRGNPNPMILNFDGSNRSVCTVSRDRSNTPVQALNLLNDPEYVEAAHAFAKIIESFPGTDREKMIAAFRRAVARMPSDAEVAALVALYEKHRSWFSVAQVILNLDETITKS